MLLISNIQQPEAQPFSSITIQTEAPAVIKKAEMLDYMITVYPRNEFQNNFPFVFSFFKENEISFSSNQDALISLATKMFAGSRDLTDFEQKVLNKTFKSSLKYKPTLPGRK